jgi:hypothetical protein
MGGGSYRSEDWARLKRSRNISAGASHDQIFKATTIDAKFDPKYIAKREALDSEEHPDSTPIIIGLDVTGSMGYLASEIANNALNETMMKLYSVKPVNDPQLMFAAVGDVKDDAPLQVTQFESDVRIGEQLLALWLELSGYDSPEDYELLWYFASRHTKTDCFDKRGKKGILFTIGDADVHTEVKSDMIKRIFDDKSGDMATSEILKEASEKYEIFHIHIDKGNTMPKEIRNLLPGRVIKIGKDDINLIPEVIIGALRMINGEKLEDVLKDVTDLSRPIVKNSLAGIVINVSGKGIEF